AAAAAILARRERFDPGDASKQSAIDDAAAILQRLERGCLVRVTMPLGLMLGLAALVLGLLAPPGLGGLQVIADDAPQTCSTGSVLAPFSLQVVNTSTSLNIEWTAEPVEKVGDSDWARVQPSNGTLAPRHRAMVQVIPNVLVCDFVARGASPLAN